MFPSILVHTLRMFLAEKPKSPCSSSSSTQDVPYQVSTLGTAWTDLCSLQTGQLECKTCKSSLKKVRRGSTAGQIKSKSNWCHQPLWKSHWPLIHSMSLSIVIVMANKSNYLAFYSRGALCAQFCLLCQAFSWQEIPLPSGYPYQRVSGVQALLCPWHLPLSPWKGMWCRGQVRWGQVNVNYEKELVATDWTDVKSRDKESVLWLDL